MFCRICYETDNPLFSPCDCSGTIKYVHPSCLSTWMEYKKSNKCDICYSEYKIFKYFIVTISKFFLSFFLYFCFMVLLYIFNTIILFF